MTIALGVMASDGIVVAADTQVTSPGYWKRDEGKIGFAESEGPGRSARACLISGAGDLAYLRTLRRSLVETFLRLNDPIKQDAITAALETNVVNFNLKHVAPYSDPPGYGPEVSMLIAYEHDGERALLSTRRGAVLQHEDYATVGAGADLAETLLSRVWTLTGFDVSRAVGLAIYVVGVVKEHIDGCGKFTNVGYLHKNRLRQVDQGLVDATEQVFNKYVADYEPTSLRRLLSAEGDHDADTQSLLERLREETADLMRQMRESPS